MTTSHDKKNPESIRVLVIDDNKSIHADFRSVFTPASDTSALESLAGAILGTSEPVTKPVVPLTPVEITSAHQGQEGLQCLQKALKERRPFELAFVDMRMPPGWDGLETIKQIWAVDPDLQVVICTAYSDYEWSDLRQTLGDSSSLLILKKPFDAIEVTQMTHALSNKWRAARLLDKQNVELKETVKQLSIQIKKREGAEQELIRQVNHDDLTALPNRPYVTGRIEQCLARAKRDLGFGYAVCFMDLDQFKYVNDSLGHNVGDELLINVARRLDRMCRRLTDAMPVDELLAGRIGGDEFVILFDGITGRSCVEECVKQIQAELCTPCKLGGHEVVVNTSIGIAMCDARYDDVGLVMRDADTALYVAKESGRARFTFFDASMHANVARRMVLEKELRHAVSREELVMYYQPIVDLESGRIASFEALMRWNHPELGAVSPVEFLPVAEDCGLIVDMGYWVLRQACTHYLQWVRGCQITPDFSIHVNVSPRQFAVSDFTRRANTIVREAGVDPSRIGIEVTETAIISDRDRVLKQIQELYDAGHPIAMDDFGTGHSSLGYLHEMPLNVVKVDRSFVNQIDPRGSYINTIKAVVEMSHNHGMRVVAEGIETREQLVQLQAIECDYGQGYLFSPAMTAEKAESMVRVPQLWQKTIEESYGINPADSDAAA